MQKLKDRVAWAIKVIKDDNQIGQNISDLELSKLLDVSEGTLNTYKKGSDNVKASTIGGLEKYFNFSIEWLYHHKGEPFPGARSKYKDVCVPEEPMKVCEHLPDYGKEAAHTPPQQFHGSPVQEFSIHEDLILAAKVLESKTHYATALHLNIRSFNGAVDDSSTLNSVLARLEDLEGKFNQIQSENNDLKDKVKKLQDHNGGCAPINLSPDATALTGTDDKET